MSPFLVSRTELNISVVPLHLGRYLTLDYESEPRNVTYNLDRTPLEVSVPTQSRITDSQRRNERARESDSVIPREAVERILAEAEPGDTTRGGRT